MKVYANENNAPLVGPFNSSHASLRTDVPTFTDQENGPTALEQTTDYCRNNFRDFLITDEDGVALAAGCAERCGSCGGT